MNRQTFKDILILTVLVLVLACAVTIVARVYGAVLTHNVENQHGRVRLATRPELCYHYYNSDSNDWIDCMGVGYVQGD